jgi:hypothetical protein
MHTRSPRGRGVIAALAALAVLLATAAPAFAFNSGGKPTGSGPTTIAWTGQGATGGVLNTTLCDAADQPGGQPAGTPYLLWILTVGGGSLQNDATTPVLHLGGSGSGNYTTSNPTVTSAARFVTPYVTPDGALSAYADLDVLTTGNGAWNLVISHGCAPTLIPPADPPLVLTKLGAGSYDQTHSWQIAKDVDRSTVTVPAGATATATYTVTLEHGVPVISNVQASGIITVANPNTGDAVIEGIVDTVAGCTVPGQPAPAIIPGGGSTDFAFTCDFGSTLPPLPFIETASVTWSDQTLSDGSPLIGGTAIGSSDPLVFTANQIDECADVVDPLDPGSPRRFCAGDAGDPTFSFGYTHDYTGDPAGTCTSHDNTATFTTDDTAAGDSASQSVEVCTGADLAVAKTAAGTFDRTYLWAITKDVDRTGVTIAEGATATFGYTVGVTQTGVSDSGWTLTGTITVTNPNDWQDVALTGLLDAVDNGGTCTVDAGPHVVPAGGALEVGYRCDYASLPAYTGLNTATATWDEVAAATPTGTASGDAGFELTQLGSTDRTVHVTDSYGGDLGTVTATDGAPYATATFTYLRTESGVGGTCTDYDNTATITETGQSASRSVELCVARDPIVAKTAAGTFERTYLWTIAKNVDKTLVEQVGGTATFTYTVDAAQTGFSDSGWALSGTITITNPNDWQAITLTGLTDLADNGGTCSVDAGPYVVPAAGTLEVRYTCTYSTQPAYDGINTATATWDSASFTTPSGTASGTAGFTLTRVGSTDRTVHVTDTFDGTTTELGTLTADDTAAYATATYTYTRTVTVPATDCVSYPNTATITETGQNAAMPVKVCGPARTGALTIGFWQNKNGQGLITTSASTNGVCNLTAWLRQYAPFQDLSASAGCSTVASYVSGVISAANAGGTSMNAMLKAQMLATALDVRFSDPALGGNRIDAPAPIGGVVIDLTNIGGTNTSAAFGGATGLSVSQLLAYAASQSDSGATTWYANVKATQQLAKNTFDAINNARAYAPF